MSRDSEDIQRRILKLLQDLLPAVSLRDVEKVDESLELNDKTGSFDLANLLTPSNSPSSSSPLSESENSPQRGFAFELGDIPAVQDRFHALLKHRLQSEIEKNLPLFPWESEVLDYENNVTSDTAGIGVNAPAPTHVGSSNLPSWVWRRQLASFNLPIKLPETVFAQLLLHCQEVVQSSLKEGAKLVQAVEDLFPGQTPELNYLAGLVMTSPARSGAIASPAVSADATLSGSYETSVPAQQMVLSLLAAREIIHALTLTVSADQPVAERQWDTELGPLSVRAVYDAQNVPLSVRIQATLPCGGSLTLQGVELQAAAQRPVAGYTSVELFEPQFNQSYPLSVMLAGQDSAPLTFAVNIVQ